MPILSDESVEREAVQISDIDYDGLLLARIATGDRIALGELYCRASASLHKVANRVLSDSSEADDVIQDVFVVIWNRASLFEITRGSALAWLAAITRRRAIDRWRVRARDTSMPAALEAEHGDCLNRNSGRTAEVRMRDEDDCRVIRCAVVALPTAMRQVIEMLFFRGLSQSEVAQELREPIGTIKARSRRALLRLKALLRQAGFENVERMDGQSLRSQSNFGTFR